MEIFHALGYPCVVLFAGEIQEWKKELFGFKFNNFNRLVITYPFCSFLELKGKLFISMDLNPGGS